jgi:hypothetical protein
LEPPPLQQPHFILSSTDRGLIPSQHPQNGGIRACPDFRHHL